MTQKVVRDRSGGATFSEIVWCLMIFGLMAIGFVADVNQKKVQEDRLAVRPEIVYENKWDNIKPLSTANFAVDIEPSQVDGEKYAVYRFSEDKDGTRYRYALQKNPDGTINTVRTEKMEPPKEKGGEMVVVPIFVPH